MRNQQPYNSTNIVEEVDIMRVIDVTIHSVVVT